MEVYKNKRCKYCFIEKPQCYLKLHPLMCLLSNDGISAFCHISFLINPTHPMFGYYSFNSHVNYFCKL